MKQLTKILAAAAIGFGVAGAVQAQTTTATFNVTANVVSACTVSATDLVFGDYTATAAAPLDAQNTISVTCTNGENYGIDLGATPTTRTMSGGAGSTLAFGMYSDSTYGAPFGFGATALTGTGIAQDYTVFGRVPAGQFAARAGAHSATVTVTVTY